MRRRPRPCEQRAASYVDVLFGAHDVRHVADMITTTYDLTRGGGAPPAAHAGDQYGLTALLAHRVHLNRWREM